MMKTVIGSGQSLIKLRVEGIDDEITPRELKEIFKRYGKIEEVAIYAGRRVIYAVITMSERDADRARYSHSRPKRNGIYRLVSGLRTDHEGLGCRQLGGRHRSVGIGKVGADDQQEHAVSRKGIHIMVKLELIQGRKSREVSQSKLLKRKAELFESSRPIKLRVYKLPASISPDQVRKIFSVRGRVGKVEIYSYSKKLATACFTLRGWNLLDDFSLPVIWEGTELYMNVC